MCALHEHVLAWMVSSARLWGVLKTSQGLFWTQDLAHTFAAHARTMCKLTACACIIIEVWWRWTGAKHMSELMRERDQCTPWSDAHTQWWPVHTVIT